MPPHALDQRRRRWREIDAETPQSIRHGSGAAAGGGHYRRATAFGRARTREQRRRLDQTFQHVYADDAVVTEPGFHRFARSGHGAGMGRRQSLAHLGAPELISDDRLARIECLARRLAELCFVA